MIAQTLTDLNYCMEFRWYHETIICCIFVSDLIVSIGITVAGYIGL